MSDRLGLLVGAAIGGAIVFLLMTAAYTYCLLPAAREQEHMLLDAVTNIAKEELTNEADRARFNRRLCIERVGVYSHASGKCLEGPPKPDG